MKRVLITQSNYIPWRGYFNNIAECDVFVIYDDVQYTKRDWRNRNLIKTISGVSWLSIPVLVKGKFFQKINEVIISEPNWNKDHWKQIKSSYSKADFFNNVSPWLEEVYNGVGVYKKLTDINRFFIEEICNFLEIKTEILNCKDFELVTGKTERLISICKELGATEYCTGPAAKQYIQEDLFKVEGISIYYFDYSEYPAYPQLYPPFEPKVSIIDLLLNNGAKSKEYLNHGK